MVSQPVVSVYSFRLLDRGVENAPIATFKATREVIVEVYHGDPLEGTREEVPTELLDEAGRYRRVATGWGALS